MSFLSGPKIKFSQPTGVNAGGLSTQFDYAGGTGGTSVTASPERKGLVSDLGNTYGSLADAYGNLASTVAPGYNDLLKARLTQVNNSRDAAIGNLRQNLDSRRVLGSSFGQDTLTRADAEFSQQRDAITADNFLKSLDASNALITQQYNALRGKFQTGLDELNLEANVGQQFSGKANDLLAANAQAQAKLDAQAQQGAGSFLGGLVTKMVPSGALGGMFGGGAAAAGGMGATAGSDAALATTAMMMM